MVLTFLVISARFCSFVHPIVVDHAASMLRRQCANPRAGPPECAETVRRWETV